VAGEWSPVSRPQANLVTPVRLDPTGQNGPTRHQAAGPAWRRTSPGRYVPATVDPSVVEQRIVEQEARLGRFAAVTGWAALRWRGAEYFQGRTLTEGELAVPLAPGMGCLRPDPAFVAVRTLLPLWEWSLFRGLRCAVWERALFDEIVRLGHPRAGGVAIDMAVAAGLGTVEEFWQFLEQVGPRNGVVLAREAASHACGTHWSPQESWMCQCWCLDAALPAPLGNVPVFDLHGELLGVPDLFDPEAGVVGEYQGAVHRDATQHRRDVERAERFRAHDLEYFEVVAGQLRDVRTPFRMREIRRRARFLPPSQRSWTLDTPAWWRERLNGPGCPVS
jgi:hypothetical protein